MDEVIHSKIPNVFFYYFEAGHGGIFQRLQFPLACHGMELLTSPGAARCWFPSIYYMHTVSSKKKSILRTPFENFKSNQYLRWWKPLCQAKLQLRFQPFQLCPWHVLKMVIFVWQNGMNTKDCFQKRLFPFTYSKGRRDHCVGTPVTHLGTEGRVLYCRIYVVFGEKRNPWINDSHFWCFVTKALVNSPGRSLAYCEESQWVP